MSDYLSVSARVTEDLPTELNVSWLSDDNITVRVGSFGSQVCIICDVKGFERLRSVLAAFNTFKGVGQ